LEIYQSRLVRVARDEDRHCVLQRCRARAVCYAADSAEDSQRFILCMLCLNDRTETPNKAPSEVNVVYSSRLSFRVDVLR
jgi:hypothetical protein